MRIKLLMLCAALFLMKQSYAELIRLPSSQLGDNYVELPALEQTNDGRYSKVWLVQDFYTLQNGAKSMKAINEFDCTQKRVRVLRLVVYAGAMASGLELADFDSSDSQREWRAIPNESFAYEAFKLVCN